MEGTPLKIANSSYRLVSLYEALSLEGHALARRHYKDDCSNPFSAASETMRKLSGRGFTALYVIFLSPTVLDPHEFRATSNLKFEGHTV